MKRCGRFFGFSDPYSVPWTALEPEHLTALRLYLAARYKPATARQAMTAVKGLIKTAWRLELLDRDRLERLVDQPAIRGTTLPTGRSLGVPELEVLLAAVGGVEPGSPGPQDAFQARAGAVLALAFGCGLRRAEIAGLELSAISSPERVVVLGKGGKERAVPVTEGSQRLLARWLAFRGTNPGGLICRLSRIGKPLPKHSIGPVAVWNLIRKLCHVAGVAAVPPHDFRRTYASQLLETGADITEVQHLMGHSDPRTTSRYDKRPERTRAIAAGRLPLLGNRAQQRDAQHTRSASDGHSTGTPVRGNTVAAPESTGSYSISWPLKQGLEVAEARRFLRLTAKQQAAVVDAYELQRETAAAERMSPLAVGILLEEMEKAK